MKTVDQIISDVIATEGGYVFDPHDPGGETNYGITVAVARANGYSGQMADLPRDFAASIYRRRYVTAPRFDQVLQISAPIATELIDTGVNMGPATASQFLQRWLNGFNNDGNGRRFYGDLFVDGVIGDLTLAALRTFLTRRRDGEVAMLRGINGVQASRYLDITEGKPSQRKFLYGWIMSRVVMA